MKLFEKVKIDYKNNHEREIRFLNIPIIQYGRKEENGTTKKYFKIFPKENFEIKLIKQMIANIKDKYDDIYLLRSGLGEAYLINYYIEAWCKKNNSKKPCFLNPNHPRKTWHIFSPIPIELVDVNWLNMRILKKTVYKLENNRVFVHIPYNIVYKMGCNYQQNSRPHIETLLNFVSLDLNSIKKPQITFEDECINKCNEILSSKNIDVNNFIFLSPDALSIPLLSDDFWQNLEYSLKKLGFSIYKNSTELNVSESVYVASKAKAIIALRSGFSEGLSAVAKKMFVLYTPLRIYLNNGQKELSYIPVDKFLSSYTLKKYPFVKPETIFEYDTEKTESNFIISDILEKLNNCDKKD